MTQQKVSIGEAIRRRARSWIVKHSGNAGCGGGFLILASIPVWVLCAAWGVPVVDTKRIVLTVAASGCLILLICTWLSILSTSWPRSDSTEKASHK